MANDKMFESEDGAETQNQKDWSAGGQLLALLKRYALKLGNFTLTSGRKFPWLINCKEVVLRGVGHALCGELICPVIRDLNDAGAKIQAIAGVPLGGYPLTSATSLTSYTLEMGPKGLGLDALYVRKEAKDHGTKSLIEGVAPKGCEVVALEDVATTGGSAIKAIETLRAAGYIVNHVIVLVDWLEGAEEALKAIGVQLTAVYDRHDFIPPTSEELPPSEDPKNQGPDNKAHGVSGGVLHP